MMGNPVPSNELTMEKNSESIDLIRSSYPHPSNVRYRPNPDVTDYIDRKLWRRAKVEKQHAMVGLAISEVLALKNNAYKKYQALWENRDSAVSENDVRLGGSVESAYRQSLDLSYNHLIAYGGRLAYLEFLKEKLGSPKSLEYPDFDIDYQDNFDSFHERLHAYKNVLESFDSSSAIHVPSLNLPELSVEESGTGKLKDIVAWKGLSIASSGMLYSKDVSHQKGIALIPREQWPFGVSDRAMIRNEWTNHKREWGDCTGEAYSYRGKEYVCIGTPNIYLAPRNYYENAVSTLNSQLEKEPIEQTQSIERSTDEIDFKKSVLEFSLRSNEKRERNDGVLDLFSEQLTPVERTFEDLSFQEWLEYARWFHASNDRYNYLLWLENEYGPFHDEAYTKALIDASNEVKDSRACAKQRILIHQGLSQSDELIELLSTGSVIQATNRSGASFIVKRTCPELCAQMYEVTCTNSSRSFPVIGTHAIARVVLLETGAEEIAELSNTQPKDPEASSCDVDKSLDVELERIGEQEVKTHSARKLGLEAVSFAACDPDNIEIIAALALSNFKEGERLLIDANETRVSNITDDCICLTRGAANEKVTYSVGTSKFFELLKEVAGEIRAIQGGAENLGLVRALNRDSGISVTKDGLFYLSDALEVATDPLETPPCSVESSSELQAPKRKIMTQGDVVRQVEELSLINKSQRTVLFRIEEVDGNLDGSVCGLTENGAGSHKWFLITQKGTFHELSKVQTKQLCDRIVGGAKRELIFDSSHLEHNRSKAAENTIGPTCD